MLTEAAGSSNEARRRRLLAQGQERLNLITSSTGKGSASRSLKFDGQEQPAQPSLTRTASGREPGHTDRQGAALRSKSWLARQESPPPSRQSELDEASAFHQAASPHGDEISASPLAPAHSASLAPVSSPAGNYASDEEAVSTPNSPLVTRSSLSSGTVLAEVPSSPVPAGSPQPLPRSANGGATPTQAPPPHRRSPATNGGTGGVLPKVQPAAAPRPTQRGHMTGAAAFQHALSASAPARTLVTIACAAFFYAGGPEAAAVNWAQRFGRPPPGAALLQHVPPLAAVLALQLLGVLLAYLRGGGPAPRQPAAASMLGGVWAAAGTASPRLHSALGVIWPVYQHLWQDIAVYIFTVALCTEAGAPRYHGHWRLLHSLAHHHASRISPGWRSAAGRWTL